MTSHELARKLLSQPDLPVMHSVRAKGGEMVAEIQIVGYLSSRPDDIHHEHPDHVYLA